MSYPLRRISGYQLFIVFLYVSLSSVAATGSSPVVAVNVENGVALKGYDPVTYFTLGQATPGMNQHTYAWKGVSYQFASSANLEQFQLDPEKYLPQYGGYCAYAMSLNRIADIDPDRWSIVEGKLYLNNNFLAHSLWSLSKSGNIDSADKNWAAWPKTTLGD